MTGDLTLEKLKIDERLRKVETDVIAIKTLIDERWDNHNQRSERRYDEAKQERKELAKSINKISEVCIKRGGEITAIKNKSVNGFITNSIKFFWGVLILLWGAIIILFRKSW